jgi:FtsZ-binding cell division protein ZapB
LELIDIKFSNYERHHRKILNSIEKKIFELEEYENSFSNEVKKMKKETENIKAENEDGERKRRMYNRNKGQGKSIKL